MNKPIITINRLFSIILFLFFLMVYGLSGNSNFSSISIAFLITDIVFLVILEYKIHNQICSPLIIWYIFWLLFIVIARFRNIYYSLLIINWSDKLTGIVILNTALFYIIYVIFDNGSYIEENDEPSTNENYNYDLIYKIVVITSIVAIILYIVNVVYVGVIPQFTSNPNNYRVIFVSSPYFKLVNITRYVFLIIPLTINKVTVEKRKMLFIFFSIYVIMLFLTAWRGYLVEALITFVSVYLLANKKTSIFSYLKILIPIFLLMFIIIGVISITRSGTKLTLDNIIYSGFRDIYLYIAPNFINLNNEIEVVEPANKFIYTTQAFWKLFASPDAMGIKDIQQSIGAYNVSPYLFFPYADYGILGTLVWTSIFSICCSLSYKKYLLTNNLFSCSMVGLMNMILSMLHNGFLMVSISPYLWIIITCFIFKFTKESTDCDETLDSFSVITR